MQETLAKRLGRILIVGGGHMGQAICAGLLDAGGISPADVCVANPGAEKRTQIEDTYDCNTVKTSSDGLPADTIVLAVKPDVVPDVAAELAAAGIGDALVISVAAGVSTARLEAFFETPVPVVRVMPNTPLVCGQGMSAVSPGAHATPGQARLVQELFGSMGRAVVIPEDQQDIACAVSGSGPAYFELVVEAIARSAERLGMRYATARELALQTMLGTAVLVDETGQDLPSAIAAVSTPGGTTAAALEAMRAGGLEDALGAGVEAATRRSRELGA